MPAFARSFALEALAGWNADHPGNAVHLLFDRWALPGQKATNEAPLRLALRDGYVSFYVKGQSVAKLRWGRDGPSLSVHKAYVAGRHRKEARDGVQSTADYRCYDVGELADPSTAALVATWVETAETHALPEKRFVDDLVAANPGIVELEMALPASDMPGSVRTAPRMDLVVAQVRHDALPTIAFWEAKCATNGELRSRNNYHEHEDGSFTGPRVLNQIGKYMRWMAEKHRPAQLQQAYRNTAATLLEFRRMFCTSESTPECVHIWQTLATADPLPVIAQPGVVIANYCPGGCTEAFGSSIAQRITSFGRDGHREKLKRNGAYVHEVGPNHGTATLPFLPSAPTSAATQA